MHLLVSAFAIARNELEKSGRKQYCASLVKATLLGVCVSVHVWVGGWMDVCVYSSPLGGRGHPMS